MSLRSLNRFSPSGLLLPLDLTHESVPRSLSVSLKSSNRSSELSIEWSLEIVGFAPGRPIRPPGNPLGFPRASADPAASGMGPPLPPQLVYFGLHGNTSSPVLLYVCFVVLALSFLVREAREIEILLPPLSFQNSCYYVDLYQIASFGSFHLPKMTVLYGLT